MAVDISQSEVAALVAIGEAFVVDTEKVQEGGIAVVDVHGTGSPGVFVGLERIAVFVGDVVAVVIGTSVGDAGLYASACHPGRETAGVVVTTIVFTGEFALAVGGSAKFTAPDHEGLVEHVALFEVGDECGSGLVNVAALGFVLSGEIAMSIPASVEDLDIANTTFGEAAGIETTSRESSGSAGIFAVKFEGLLIFLAVIHQFWNGTLHPVGHFMLFDPGQNFRISKLFVLRFVQCGQGIELSTTILPGNILWIGQVQHWVSNAAKEDALVF